MTTDCNAWIERVLDDGFIVEVPAADVVLGRPLEVWVCKLDEHSMWTTPVEFVGQGGDEGKTLVRCVGDDPARYCGMFAPPPRAPRRP